MKITAAAVLSALALSLAGCSVQFGGAEVKEADLEKSVSQTLAGQVGETPDKVDCPGDLKGEVGESMRCTVTAGGETLGATVTVTSVDGDTVNYDVKVDPAAPTATRTPAPTTTSAAPAGDVTVEEAELERSVSATLAEQAGQVPDRIDCPGDLDGTVGTTMRCTLTAGADTLGVTVTVTSVDGDTVNYDVEVDQR
ncbi:DUF4333 domain-containing protein [Nocardia thailandica]|uniref:DUF4333 domain-containing protein n=1 Tax=Nocardia thailandica TaxID=257275 RepID=A0ABW6PQ62_9NOCA